MDWRAAAALVDHTLLDPEATREQIVALCAEAARFGFAAVCVNPYWVALAASLLRETPVKVCGVIGFPLGADLTAAKSAQAEELLRLGADELDMVMNIGALKSGERTRVEADIRAVADVTHAAGGILKVILETVLLSPAEKVVACELSVAAGADYVKTSTGFAAAGATPADVALLRSSVGRRAGVKASGGIHTAADFCAMVAAGADRIGSSASVAIMHELGAPK